MQQFIDFETAQQQLTNYLNKKLMGEKQGASMEKRAQKLVDGWWARRNRPRVAILSSGLEIVGCTLAFDIGTIKVAHWTTRFVHDVHGVHVLSPGARALGYVNGYQMFACDIAGTPHLVARQGQEVLTWKTDDTLIPPSNSPLRVALDRAKALGYLNYLKGSK